MNTNGRVLRADVKQRVPKTEHILKPREQGNSSELLIQEEASLKRLPAVMLCRYMCNRR